MSHVGDYFRADLSHSVRSDAPRGARANARSAAHFAQLQLLGLPPSQARLALVEEHPALPLTSRIFFTFTQICQDGFSQHFQKEKGAHCDCDEVGTKEVELAGQARAQAAGGQHGTSLMRFRNPCGLSGRTLLGRCAVELRARRSED